jgi:HEAT repeat protein
VGLLDIIKPKSALEKASKAIREPYSQPEYRREAMQKLLEMATEEAYDALLMRFTFNSHGGIADEDEKNDLVEELVKVGRPALPALTRFIQREKQIAFPVRAYSRIVEKQALLDFLVETLKKYEPLDHRSTQAKATLISSIHDYGTPAQATAVVPYLGDHHDDVQFQAISALEKFKDPSTREALAQVCVEGSHSARIQSRAAQVLADLEWPVKEVFDKMTPELRSEFLLSKKGTLIRKHAAPSSSST